MVYRWTAIGWPHKIVTQMEQTEKQLDEDEERFHKLQMTDAANFNDRLDSLSVTCSIAAHILYSHRNRAILRTFSDRNWAIVKNIFT